MTISTGCKVVVMGLATRWQHFFMPNSLLWQPEPEGKSSSSVVRESGLCLKKHPSLVSHYFFPLIIYLTDKSQLLPHHSAVGTVICRWGDPKEGGWRWEPHHQETGNPGSFSQLFQPRVSTILWVHQACFRCRRARLDLGIVGSRRGEQALQVHRGGSLAGTSSSAPSAP